MIALEIVVIFVLLAGAIYVVLGRRAAPAAVWKVITRTEHDGTLVVALRGPEGGERVVKELPPALSGPDLTSELRLAREEAQFQADELNRGLGARTRS